MDRLVRAYFQTERLTQRVNRLIEAVVDGVWLGVLDRSALDRVDEAYYKHWGEYDQDAYNLGGLTEWEAEAIDRHFPSGGRVVVTGAGAGREVLGLIGRGFDAVGYEPNEELVLFGAGLLERQGHAGLLRTVERDAFPDGGERWDGVVVGWCSYMLIPGRSRRVAFLRSARERVPEAAPALLSFYAMTTNRIPFVVTARIANVIRRVRRRDPVEVGDALSPNYAHHFTREEIESELRDAGFSLVAFDTAPYPHAVARAV